MGLCLITVHTLTANMEPRLADAHLTPSLPALPAAQQLLPRTRTAPDLLLQRDGGCSTARCERSCTQRCQTRLLLCLCAATRSTARHKTPLRATTDRHATETKISLRTLLLILIYLLCVPVLGKFLSMTLTNNHHPLA